MRDEISLPRLNLLHPKALPIFRDFIEKCENELGIVLRVTQGLRTIAEQDALYAQGRTKPGSIVTNAKGGSSYHNYGLAIDLVPIENGEPQWGYDYTQLAQLMPGNMKWGGEFKSLKDKPHFQIPFGYTVKQLFEKSVNGDCTDGYVNVS